MDGIKNLKINTSMFSDQNRSFKLSHDMVGTKVIVEDESAKKKEPDENKDTNDIRRKI